MREALAWYLVVQVAGLAVWPLVARALAPLDDRGWAFSKSAGLLATAWLIWLACMLTPLPFSRATLVIAVFVVGSAAWLWFLRGPNRAAMVLWLGARRWLLVAWEAVFLAAFVLFAV